MEKFIAEVCKACGTTFEQYLTDCQHSLEREVAEAFGNHPCAGILDHLAAVQGERKARSTKVRRVIESHRGKFSIVER